MIKTIKKYKRGIIAWAIVLLFLLILYEIFWNKTHLTFIKPETGNIVDAQLRNYESYNGFITTVDGNLYVDYTNHACKSGIYEISPSFSRCINWFGFFWDKQDALDLGYSYNGMLLESNPVFQDDNTAYINDLITGKAAVTFDNKKYDITTYFTLDNELYLKSRDGRTVFHYSNGELDTVVSEELCGKGYIPYQYYKGCLYYYNESNMNNSGFPLNLFRYNLSKKESLGVLDLGGMSSVFEQKKGASCEYYICDKCIFYKFYQHDKTEYYRYDWNSGKAEKIFVTEGSTSSNAYGDNLYICVTGNRINNEEKGLYTASSNSKTTLLKSGDFWNIAIIDDKWIYLKSPDRKYIYRTSIDGKVFHKVF